MDTRTNRPRFELCFRPLFPEGRPLAFPCDAEGHVEMDALDAAALERYLYARVVMGRAFAPPAVRTVGDGEPGGGQRERITRA